jgi:hypothetical protein
MKFTLLVLETIVNILLNTISNKDINTSYYNYYNKPLLFYSISPKID